MVDDVARPFSIASNTAETIVACLASCGIRGLSRYGARRNALAAPGVLEINAHVDIVDWKGGRAFVGAEQALLQATRHLAARREGRGCSDKARYRVLSVCREPIAASSRSQPGVFVPAAGKE